MKTSESISKVAAALVSAKSDLINPPKSGFNPHYKSKYTTLDDLENHIRPILAKHRLCALSPAISDSKGVGAAILILHESGEYIEFDPIFLPLDKQNAQAAGSAVTYAMRYALCSALSIAGEEDDDGNRAIDKTKPEDKGDKMISKDQARQMIELAGGDVELLKSVLAHYKISSSKETPEYMFKILCNHIAQAVKDIPA